MKDLSINLLRLIKVVILFSLLVPLPGLSTGAFAKEASPFAYTRPKERFMAPDFTLPSTGGAEKSLADYRGKVLLLNFWSTVCAPCREEMPALESLWKELGEEGLVVIGINVDRRGERLAGKFMERYGLSFPVLFDREGEVRREYEVMVLPVTYIVGRDGRFVGRVTGVRDWDGEEVLTFFRKLAREEGR